MDELNYVANIIKILLPMCNIGVGLKCHCIEKRGADLKWKFCFMSRVVVFMIMEFLPETIGLGVSATSHGI